MNQSIKKDTLLSTSLGNTIEWFDFALFIYFAPLIGEKFFPIDNSTNATLAAFGVFAVGFICRPLGGILFGYAGDTRGRAGALRISLLAISIPTLLIGLLPGYQSIGITAPILFILLRMIQGVSIGGEYSGVMIYLAELAPAKKRGFFTSFAALGANLGFLSATLVLMLLNTFLSAEVVSAWAWRLPFILAGFAGTLLLYFRFKLPETPTFAYLRTTHLLEKRPLMTALKKHPGPLLKIIGLSCMSSTLYYLFFGFIPNQLKQQINNVSTDKLPLIMQSVSLMAMLFLVPLAGLCGDYFGRRRMLMLTTSGTLILAIPAFQLLYSASLIGIGLAFFLAFCLSSFDQGNTLCAVVENCPANIRYSGVSFSYNLGNAIFGGTAPLVATLLSEKFGYLGPAYYLMVTSSVSLFAASTLLAKEEPLYDAG